MSAPPPYSEKSPPPPYSEHDEEKNAPPPSGYGQAYPSPNQPYPGQTLAQPYQPQQALSNNSKTFSISVFLLEPDFVSQIFKTLESPADELWTAYAWLWYAATNATATSSSSTTATTNGTTTSSTDRPSPTTAKTYAVAMPQLQSIGESGESPLVLILPSIACNCTLAIQTLIIISEKVSTKVEYESGSGTWATCCLLCCVIPGCCLSE